MTNTESLNREARMQETMEKWVKEYPHLHSILTHPTMSTQSKYAFMKDALLGATYGGGANDLRKLILGSMQGSQLNTRI